MLAVGPLLASPLLHPQVGISAWQDDAGRPWQRPNNAPKRWLVFGPQLVEMVEAVGAGAHIVGVQDDRQYVSTALKSLRGYPVVGHAAMLNRERLLQARADVAIYWPSGMSPDLVEQLERLKIPLLAIDPKHLEDIPERLRWLGALSHREVNAEHVARTERQHLRSVRQRYQEGTRLRGLYQIWHQPIYSLSRQHILSEAMSICGIDNIVPATRLPAPILSQEFILAAKPEVILSAPDMLGKVQAQWRAYPQVPAVQRGAILAVNDEALTKPGLSLLRSIDGLCQQVMPWRIR